MQILLPMFKPTGSFLFISFLFLKPTIGLPCLKPISNPIRIRSLSPFARKGFFCFSVICSSRTNYMSTLGRNALHLNTSVADTSWPQSPLIGEGSLRCSENKLLITGTPARPRIEFPLRTRVPSEISCLAKCSISLLLYQPLSISFANLSLSSCRLNHNLCYLIAGSWGEHFHESGRRGFVFLL